MVGTKDCLKSKNKTLDNFITKKSLFLNLVAIVYSWLKNSGALAYLLKICWHILSLVSAFSLCLWLYFGIIEE